MKGFWKIFCGLKSYFFFGLEILDLGFMNGFWRVWKFLKLYVDRCACVRFFMEGCSVEFLLDF